MSIVNKPEVSKAIAWTYRGFVILIATTATFFVYAGLFTPMGSAGLVVSLIVGMIGIIFLLLLRSLFHTRYILGERELVIKTTRLIGGEKRIPLGSVETVEKTLIPLGIRRFGASFHGGYYSIPGLGRAFLAITNFEDGILIRTGKGNFIITPKNPIGFKKEIELRIE